MKPPVEAPTSRAVSPAGGDAERVEGAPKFEAAPAHVGARLAPDPDLRIGGDRGSRLVRRPVADEDRSRQDQRLRLLPVLGQAPPDEEVIQADFGYLVLFSSASISRTAAAIPSASIP